MMPRILFHRDFTGYTGGHGKVWDYFRHALALGWDARVYFTPQSLRDASNPWMAMPDRIEPAWEPDRFDLLFLAGMDWVALPDVAQPPRPVVNLLQGVRHAAPELPLRGFLRAPAHRLCVSRAVTEAVLATGEVNGPLEVVPAALDMPEDIQRQAVEGDGRVLIAGLKAPALAQALKAELQARGRRVELLEQWLPRREYLSRVARSAVAVTLPLSEEGFYLPALEAMALGVPVVLGDCLGSREYARDGENCLLSALEPRALADVVEVAMQPALAMQLRREGLATAAAFDPSREREAFARVLRRMGAVGS